MGFQELGHEVWYLEDTGTWAYDQVAQTYTKDSTANVAALSRLMQEFGLEDRWIYRNGADGKLFGLPEAKARDVLKNCDLIANVSGAAILEGFDCGSAHLMFLDGDPMFTQLAMLDPAKPESCDRVRRHHSHFSFGLNLGFPDCLVPTLGISWKRTVQPISLNHWSFAASPPTHGYSTVMNWASYAPKEWQGQLFGQKDLEFQHFLELPLRTPHPFALAMGQGPGQQRPTEKLRQLGWIIHEPDQMVPDHLSYRQFLSNSRAEWSVAKHGYVHSNSGWFSCRTACYLASGRPAVVQETGWSRFIPSGEGLFAFRSLDECVDQIARLESDYTHHRRAARRLAEEYFAAPLVCADLLRNC